MRLRVHQAADADVYRDMVRIPEQERVDRKGIVPEGSVCRLSTDTGISRLVVVRGIEYKEHPPCQEACIHMDAATRRSFEVHLYEFYEFHLTRQGWWGRLRWARSATEIGYQISAQLGFIGLWLGITSLVLGSWSVSKPFVLRAGKGTKEVEVSGRFIPDSGFHRSDFEKAKGGPTFDQFIYCSIVQAQKALAQFGYGVRFTGKMDEQITQALRQYQQRSTLPITGDLDPATQERLRRDQDAITEPVVPTAPLDVSISGTLLSAEGVWVKQGTDLTHLSVDSMSAAHIQCWQNERVCHDMYNVVVPGLVNNTVTPEVQDSDVTKWSSTHVEAHARLPESTLQYSFDITGRKVTRALISANQIISYDLMDGSKLYQELIELKSQAERRIILLPPPPGGWR
jgi:hypothetical protein